MIIQSVGSVQFCVETGHLLKTRMPNFYFVTLGMLAHAVLVWLVWCEGNRVNHRTTTGQLQDNYNRGQL